VAGEEGILEIVLCREESDGSSVKVIVLFVSFIFEPDGIRTVQSKLNDIHLPISSYF